MEWQYVHRTVSDAGTFFDGVEEALESAFLPSLSVLTKTLQKVSRATKATTNCKECYKSSTLYTPTSCLPYAVDVNTVQLTILNAKARLCQYIGVVSKQPTRQNSNPKSIMFLRILIVP